jgi:hypothetical protein
VLRILLTGKPPVRGGGGMPQRIIVSSRSAPALRTTGAAIVWKHARHGREVSDVAVHHAEQSDDRSLVRGD